MPRYLDPFGDGHPGPYVTLRVTWGGGSRDLLALVDSGADGSQIPDVTAQALGLQQIDTQTVIDANGNSQDRPVYVVNAEFEGFTFDFVEVVGSDYPIALVGRDVLNELITTLNGPASVVDFVRPAAAAPTAP